MDNFQKIWRETMAAIAELYSDFSLPAAIYVRRFGDPDATVLVSTEFGPMDMKLIDALLVNPIARFVFKLGVWASFPRACWNMIIHAIALSFQELRKKNG